MSVYLEAAKAVEGGDLNGACWAIANVCNHKLQLSACGPATKYAELFKPREGAGGWWGLEWGDDEPFGSEAEKVRECRVLSLLFMHAMTAREKL